MYNIVAIPPNINTTRLLFKAGIDYETSSLFDTTRNAALCDAQRRTAFAVGLEATGRIIADGKLERLENLVNQYLMGVVIEGLHGPRKLDSYRGQFNQCSSIQQGTYI